MSSLENTIGEVIAEAADIQHKVPGKGDAAPAAMANPDADAEKNASKAAKDAGESTKEAPKTNAAPKGDSMEVVSDGQTKVEKDKAVNQEEVEVEDAPALEEMSKADLLKHAVNSMKEMKVEDIQALVSEGEDDDDEKSESLSRNALIRKVVESLKDQSIAEITDFIKELDNDSDDGKSKEMQKKTTKKEETEIEEASKEEETDEEEAEEEEESVKKEEVEIDMTDDINALVADEDLTEEFKAKAKTIFEAAVASKVKEELAEKEAKLEEETNQKIEEIKDDLTEKVDSYLNYVSESWVKENELAIERGLKSELTEDFISGLKKLFEEHYVEVPEDKFDVVEELANRLDEMEDKLNEEVANNITAQQDIEELQREKIISEASNDLADTQVEKLKSLSEDVDFENVENFVEKVSTLKESYFGSEKMEAVSDDSTVASSDADFSSAKDVPVNDSMSRYTSALSKFASLEK